MFKKSRNVVVVESNVSYWTYPGLNNLEELEEEVSRLKELWLWDHPSIDWVKVAKIEDKRLLPKEIREVIDRIKWKTTDIFEFCVVEVSEDIPEHYHDEGVWEVYFAGDWWVNIKTTLWKDHLKKWRFHVVWPGETHLVEKIDNKKSTFVAVKFIKENNDK